MSAESDNQDSSQIPELSPNPQRKATDSVWFWATFFFAGALLALALTVPKYRQRQAQIEKQYQARVTSGYAKNIFSNSEGSPEQPSESSQLRISLLPLACLIAAAGLGFAIGFWVTRRERR